MASNSDINLLAVKTNKIINLSGIEKEFKRVSYFLLILLIFTGIGTAIFFTIAKNQQQSLLREKESLISIIKNDLIKEGLYLSVKERVAVAGNVTKILKPWDKAIEYALDLASPPDLSSISLDENQLITLQINAGSIDTALEIINSLSKMFSDKKIINPRLVSLSLGGDEKVALSVAYTVRF